MEFSEEAGFPILLLLDLCGCLSAAYTLLFRYSVKSARVRFSVVVGYQSCRGERRRAKEGAGKKGRRCGTSLVGSQTIIGVHRNTTTRAFLLSEVSSMM
ncbi:hypothetical protein QBC32DRAFT_331973, partial [Pseudoneurospora amorphoporcata]